MSKPIKRIPIASAKAFAKRYGQKQVCVVAWDGETQHVVTYGVTDVDCDQAARLGNLVKKALNWPSTLCHTEPNRVKKLKAEIARLKAGDRPCNTPASTPDMG